MKTSDLDYHLPNEFIAQEPIEPRDASRLLVLDRASGNIEHTSFNKIGNYLRKDDLLVVNDTKVLPARLIGKKQSTNAKIEVLLLAEAGDLSSTLPTPTSPSKPWRRRDSRLPTHIWEVLAKPAKRLKPGDIIKFDSDLRAEVLEELENGRRLVRFITKKPLINVLHKIGQVPLPPYIATPLLHPDRYQTVYAKKQESAAAPTAGLHFTPSLIEELRNQEVGFAHLTLRIGLDTFQPIRNSIIEDHKIHSEYYEVGSEAAEALNKAVKDKHRVIAVGTTSARVLETLAQRSFANAQDDKIRGHSEAKSRRISETTGCTDLFIYPSYRFKIVDAMITNFHLPRTTLLAMVSTFAGLEKTKMAYQEAINNKYRFFSFGDSMFII